MINQDVSSQDWSDKIGSTLIGDASKYIIVPSSLIKDIGLTDKRLSVFSFFMIKKGMDDSVGFSIEQIIKWCGLKPNNHKGRTNDIFSDIIDCFNKSNYLQLTTKPSKSSNFAEAHLNMDYISNSSNTFSILYLDEIMKILNYHNAKSRDTTLNTSIILLVFAYLRWRITRREHRPSSNVIGKNYDLNYPDAYDCYFIDIEKDIGIKARTISKAVSALIELKLIYIDKLNKTHIDDKWYTEHTIFVNMYKREKNRKTGEIELVAAGSNYYLKEIYNKRKKMGLIDTTKGGK